MRIYAEQLGGTLRSFDPSAASPQCRFQMLRDHLIKGWKRGLWSTCVWTCDNPRSADGANSERGGYLQSVPSAEDCRAFNHRG